MEAIHSYRHIIDPKVAGLFESAIREAVKKRHPKNLGFIGLVLDYKKKEHHDLDVLIFPAKGAKIGEAIMELFEIYDEVEKNIKKKHERYYLAISPKKSMQELIYYISGLEEGTAGLIPVHSLFFPDYKSFKKFSPETFEREIGSYLRTIWGEFDVIRSIPELPQEKLEPYFVLLDFEMSARIKTFPRHNIRASAESLFNYLRDKYGIQTPKKIPNDVKEIEKEFINLIRILDKKTYG